MLGYIIRRILVAIIITIGIAAITFELLHLIAGSPVHQVLGRSARPAQVAAWNKSHGYDRPLVAQFMTYLAHLGRLDFGYSYKQGQSVAQLFKENAGRSIYLSGSALVLSLLIAIPIGILQAVRRNSLGDYAMTTLTFVLYAMPPFFLGIILIDVFALHLTIFPPLVPVVDHLHRVGDHAPARLLPPHPDTDRGQHRLVLAATCAPRRSTTWPRTTFVSHAPRGSRRGRCCTDTCCATRACR